DEKGDQGDGDLNADCILGGSNEMSDSKRLLDPAEEQFDLPALFVKVCDFFCPCVEIIGHDAQQLAGVDDHGDLPDRNLQRILAAVGESCRQMADAVAHNIAVPGRAVLLYHSYRSILLQPCHEAAAGLIKPPPPAIIVITEIIDVGCTRLDRHGFGGCDV